MSTPNQRYPQATCAIAEAIIEAIWVAAEMRAGAAYSHAALALDTIARHTADHASIAHEVADLPSPDAEARAGSSR